MAKGIIIPLPQKWNIQISENIATTVEGVRIGNWIYW
jgi:hypothetical protein